MLSRESYAFSASAVPDASSARETNAASAAPSDTSDIPPASSDTPIDTTDTEVPADTSGAPGVSPEAPADTSDLPPRDPDIPPDRPTGPPDAQAPPSDRAPDGGDQRNDVRFSSSDSLIFTTRDERRATLYGNARVGNDNGELTAGEVLLNLDKNEVSAQAAAPEDTLSQPVLQRGQDRIRSERIAYNYETDKGKFDVARVTMDQGNVIGTQVKRTAPHVVFVEDGIYSTCDLDHPHFYIRANRMKVVDEDEIFFTRARLFILDIPYPLVFPFGYVPSQIRREQSGLLEPSFTYQEQQRRGLGLQNLGWFQYFNEYLTGQISTDLFTSGTYFIDSRLNYSRTDQYSGNIQFSYSRDQGLEPTDPDFTSNIQRRIGINHRQTINPYSSISANINLRTADYYNRNSYDVGERAEVSTQSSASYNFNHPDGTYNVSVSGRHSQNFATDVTTLTGPDVNFSMRRFTPFQRTGPATDQSWYESLNIQYRSELRSRFDYRPLEDTDIGFLESLFSPSKHRDATGDFRHIKTGIRHNAGVNTQLFSSTVANLSANLNLNEYWYPQTLRQEWNEEEEQIISRMESGFAAGRDFSTGLSANTTIYGMSEARIGKFEGFRHTMRPSLSFNYSPDFSDPVWGYYREVQSNVEGDTRRYSIFDGGIVGGPSSGRQQTMSLSISNNLETKEVRRDTTGERSVNTVRLIDRLNLSASYNFAAERFNLSDLSTSMSTSYFQNLNLNANATFSFYDTDDDGNRIDQYLWEESSRFIRLTNFRFSTSTEFRSGEGMRGGGRRSQWHYPEHYDPLDQSRFHPVDRAIRDGRIERIDVPWSMRVTFNYSWRKQGGQIRQNAVINAQSIQVRLTPEWQVGTQLGYDFIEGRVTPSRFNVTRNLHCWNLSFQWNPFDDMKFFMFRLTVADSRLQGLFQKLPGLNNLERSSSPINRF